MATGTVEAVGLLDQWLIEEKYTEEEALVLSCDMLAAGMDTVSSSMISIEGERNLYFQCVHSMVSYMKRVKFFKISCINVPYNLLTQTSNTAMFLLYELAKHPEIQERMYQEIRSTVQDRKHPTWEDIQNMKLVRNSIKESMRLYLPVGVLPRILSEDAVLNGYQVPAGVRNLFVGKE